MLIREDSPVLRIRTHLITEHDDIVKTVAGYCRGIAFPGDVVAVAESVVAITQGRAIPPEEIKPGFLAKFLSRFASPDASVSAPRSMQMAIKEAGVPRIIFAAFCALVGKAIGKRGLFFKVAGHKVAEIDDTGGTMPPYDRHVVLGPADPSAVARRIWRKTGVFTVICDANDKGIADILGSSFSLKPETTEVLRKILSKNPFGNDDQRTPIVVIKACKTA